ncbi:hypothetical protein DXX93_12170 [Thalassotalea euphylliae]|uniref:DUF6436 domain-containing protein n=1 Tax=Thalassotalea euphylliae TaxID=1655234 RepID=A0A3E0TRK4_9GAMM|nr:DUF6436 domain-containing protein [Thalassotalea euphylliae]REL27246.1 hypothetical protein DXX93_12170 [Thalassotalea euphylliae]
MTIKKRQILIVVSWVLITIISFAYLINKRVVEFDPNRFLVALSHQEVLANWQKTPEFKTSERAIVHFQQAGCHCNTVSERHINAINKQAINDNFAIKQLTLTGQLQALVPSTPAVAIIDKGQLVYFGPYGEGIACSQTNGFAQTVLSNLQKGYAANLVVSDAKGCYCHS